MAGTFTPYARPEQRASGGIRSHRSHSDHSANAGPHASPDRPSGRPVTSVACALEERASSSYSAWLADTARKEFTIRAGLAAVSQFEQDHGAFTPEELAEAQQWAATAVERAGRTGGSAQRRTA